MTYISDDSVLVIDAKTGCMFVGDVLIHSDTCVCGEDDGKN